MKKAFACMALLASLIVVSGCAKSDRTISVSGVGTVTYVPDMIVLSITVKNTNPRLADALAQTKSTIADLLTVSKKFGIADADIKSSFINTDKEYTNGNYNTEPKFIGYSATQTSQITYRDLARFEEFSAELLALRVTSINNVTFSHSKASDYSSEADLLALDDAKASAQKMAERMNIRLGKILYLTNSQEASGFSGDMMYERAYSKNLSGGIVVSPGILSVSRAVHVVYQIR